MPEELYGKLVHIWTDEEIQSLPCTENWFYGLVRQEDGRIVLSEIHPSIGRSDFELFKETDDDRSDEEFLMEIFSWIGSDILHWNPKSLIEAIRCQKVTGKKKWRMRFLLNVLRVLCASVVIFVIVRL